MERYDLPAQERAVLERLREPLAVYQYVDKRVVTLALSDGFCELFGYTDRAQAYFDMDNNMYRDTHPDDVARIADAAVRFATEGGRYEAIYRTRDTRSGGYRVVHASGEHFFPVPGVQLAHIWYTDEGRYQEENGRHGAELNRTLSNALHENSLVKASRYDYLTGLPSMTYFFELADAGKAHIQRAGGKPVLMYMDFSGMKFYNARHGFAEGDRLLQSFAKILSDTFGNECCCRIGADHFAVSSERDGLEDRLGRMFAAFDASNGKRAIPVHVGVYVAQNDRVHVSLACDRAKLACRALSSRYESAVKYYDPRLSVCEAKRQYIVENLDRAIRERWIQIYFQPIIRAVNERVCNVEALARWIDPENGFLSPADFIPALEDTGLIYKLDLYMVDLVLEAIRTELDEGFDIVPHSINLSRVDFDACDIVEEIRRRVDEAGVSRDRIIIEITESVIGSDYTFMKEQVERFRALGFPVWMDDFGSGYSSLDVLQSIRFDLLKFDMSFMRRLNEGNGRVILTELMRLATSLGVDTLCEGVETREQLHFLQEIGCSKLQGYYFSKPIAFTDILELHRKKALFENENPEESDYYESIGRVNLYDLGVIASDEESVLRNTFSTIPIAILEVSADTVRYVRSSRSYWHFANRFFHLDLSEAKADFATLEQANRTGLVSAIRQCCRSGNPAFFTERVQDGHVLHFYARRIQTNPVTGSTAVALAVLSITDPDESTTYADIARALAADYYNIFVVDLETEDYIEYSSQVGGEELSIERHGTDFFAAARRDVMTRVFERDRDSFLNQFTKEQVVRELDRQGVFTATYRLVDTGEPMYVNMKITRMNDGRRIILGVSNVDAHMKQREKEKRLQQEKLYLGRIAALSPDYFVLYTVEPDTGHYMQYSPSREFEQFGLSSEGEDFFADVVLDAPKAIAPEDRQRHLRLLTKDNMLREIAAKGFFTHNYRMMMDGRRIPATLKATMVEENGRWLILLGVMKDENVEFRRKVEESRRISELNQTITSLLDNMPGMTFTKDAKTGVYLACNQAFAAYAHKATPSGVVGLTDAEIFDEETARHFVEDDQIALATDKPYIFFEDVPDAVGNQRQFQTTKLKYTDASGRLCLQGMCQDVTDMVRIQRENATTKQAYERAQSMVVIYTHLAHALARGFTDLFYVNMDTDEFIEFHTDDASGVLTEARRSTDFFEGCGRDARIYIHPEDQAKFVGAMSREFLAGALSDTNVYEMTYRRIKDGRTFYVQMKVSRMEDDPRFLVISVSDIDELMRKRRDEERVQEERTIYARLHALTGNFICVYVVDPETGRYREFSSTDDYVESFARAKEGLDFFRSVRRDAKLFTHPDDINAFLGAFTKANVLGEIERSGIFTHGYRLMMNGRPLYVQMKAAMVEEKEGPRLIVGLNDVDIQHRQKEADREIARQKEIYDQITSSLTEQYDTLYYIDTATNTYTEISATDDYKKLNVPATGNDFFAESRRSIRKFVHPEDQQKAIRLHYKDVMLDNLKNRTSFSMEWRLVVGGKVRHIRHTEIMARDGAHIIVCIKNIDAEVQAKLAMKASQQKSVTYTQIAERLASHFDMIYYIDCESSKYAEFSTKQISGELKIQSEGDDFFAISAVNIDRLIYAKDRERIRLFLDRDHLISQLENRRQLNEDYRLILNTGKLQYTRMSVTYSSDHSHFIICVENREEDVRREKEHLAALNMANEMARRDELTHTKNKTAYHEVEQELQKQIEDGGASFGIVVCDINGLKVINDTQGHKAGDDYIRSSCKLICKVFHHSPVFRIGGDEFVVILRGQDFRNRSELLSGLRQQVEEHIRLSEGPVVASGLSEYRPGSDRAVVDVFNRADGQMYEDKARLKELKHLQESHSLIGKSNIRIITEERRVKLDALYKAFEVVAEGTYVYLCDMKYDFSRWSKNAVDAFGLPSEYMYGAGDIWENQIHPEDREVYHKGIDEIFSGIAAGHDMQYRAKRTTGVYDACTCRGVVIRDQNGEPDYFAGIIRNHAIQGQIDSLTGLRNQYGFFEDLDSCIKRRTGVSVILFSLSRFSEINEIYGYHFGNRVLQLCARSIYEAMVDTGHTYRIDGATFAVLSNSLSMEELRQRYHRFRTYLHGDFRVDDKKILLDLHCGAVRVDRFDVDSQTVYACLNYANAESKLRHQGELVEFQHDHNTQNHHRLEKLHAIRASITHGYKGFYLLYQPVVDAQTEQLIGAEALLRWRDERYGVVPPDQFIPVLESDPLFPELGEWIIRQAVLAGKRILERYPEFIINVNLSYTQLEKPDFVDMVLGILNELEFPPEHFCFEVTERCRLLDLTLLKQVLSDLMARGILVALDDFGTGFSSVGILKEIPINIIKIDRSFVRRIEQNDLDRKLVRNIADLASIFSAKVCVEGIETAGMRDILKGYHVESFQGYYYAKPLLLEQFLDWNRDKLTQRCNAPDSDT